jgi:hypothetical protein
MDLPLALGSYYITALCEATSRTIDVRSFIPGLGVVCELGLISIAASPIRAIEPDLLDAAIRDPPGLEVEQTLFRSVSQ